MSALMARYGKPWLIPIYDELSNFKTLIEQRLMLLPAKYVIDKEETRIIPPVYDSICLSK
jgi:hypothetical protein